MEVMLMIAGAIVVLVLLYFIAVNNKLEQTTVKIQEADSGIDVFLQKRFDTLTKLVDITKSYATYEKETLLEAIKIRSQGSIPEREKTIATLDQVDRDIRVIAENYPQLKASDLFRELQKAAVDAEDHLQAARRLYNANVSSLNQMIVSFPQSIIANMKGIQPKEMFKADPGKKEDVDVSITID